MRKIDGLHIIGIKKLADSYIKINTDIRLGQAVFNATYHYFPIAADKLRETKYDCFYEDSRIDLFLDKLRELDAE